MKKLKYLPIIVLLITLSCKRKDHSKVVSISKKEVKPQVKNSCGCESDSIKTLNTINCDTTTLRNNSKLYYQFNCDSIWLTLENLKEKKTILYSEKENFNDFFGIQWRLAFKLMKEFDQYLLFRSDCPANGPCNFVLFDKNTGEFKKEFGELIYDHESQTFYDFVLYFSKTENTIIADFIDSNKQFKIPIDKTQFSSITPEYNFDIIHYDQGIITLKYYYGDYKKTELKEISVNTRK
ncbi:MAG: hypothetical protein ACRCVT_01755 [Leadbetterella sp.]